MNESGEWTAIGALDRFPDGLSAIEANGRELCLARQGNRVWCVEDRCPHAMLPLSDGEIAPGGRLRCRYHGWEFPLDAGEETSGFPRPEFVETRVEDGKVWVRAS